MLSEIFIFLITLVLSFSSFSVVTNKNPVHAVFFLISTFAFSALLLLYFFVEFIALLFIVVYVGAIAVLFLFVVMMLDLRSGFSSFDDEEVFSQTALIITVSLFLFWVLFFFDPFFSKTNFSSYQEVIYFQFVRFVNDLSNIQVIGELLYTFHAPVFILAAYLLLLAMLGSIMLTLKNHFHNRKQYSFLQLERDMDLTVSRVKY